MDEKEIQNKLGEIKDKREEYKKSSESKKQCAFDKNVGTLMSEKSSSRPVKPLTDEEITRRMKEWRESPNPDCSECGLCPAETEPSED